MFCNGTMVGTVSSDKSSKVRQLHSYDQSPPTTLTVYGKHGINNIFDSSGALVATIDEPMRRIVQLKFHKELSETEKKLVLAETIILSKVLYKLHTEILPAIRISTPIQSHPTLISLATKIHLNIDYLKASDCAALIIRAAGYNRYLNVVYFDVLRENHHRKSFLTLECTPTYWNRGLAQVVAKSKKGHIIFSAVSFPENKTLAIYSGIGNLLAYVCQNRIMAANDQQLMYVEEKTLAYLDEKKWGSNLCFILYDSLTGHKLAVINRREFAIRGYITHAQRELQQPLSTAIFISFALGLFYSHYQFDDRPMPEITYHYNDFRPNPNSLLLTN